MSCYSTFLQVSIHSTSLTNFNKILEDYSDAHHFAEDIRQIFNNCYKYNPEGHDVVQMARKLSEVSLKLNISLKTHKYQPKYDCSSLVNNVWDENKIFLNPNRYLRLVSRTALLINPNKTLLLLRIVERLVECRKEFNVCRNLRS